MGVPLILLPIVFVVIVAALGRWQRARHRLDLQKAVLERTNSVKDLAEFLATDQGERFLASLEPAAVDPHRRVLLSIQVGIVLLTVGLFLMTALHTTVFGTFVETRPLLMAMLLLIATGLGLLISAAASLALARLLGSSRRRDAGPTKDRAV
jgi:hypothetical protein